MLVTLGDIKNNCFVFKKQSDLLLFILNIQQTLIQIIHQGRYCSLFSQINLTVSNHLIAQNGLVDYFMQRQKNPYVRGEIKKESPKKLATSPSKSKKFDISKLDQIDNILAKNEVIYKDLRRKLQQINKVERKITNNLNFIRPIYYSSRQRDLEAIQYEKPINDMLFYERALALENYVSSPIQTERMVNELIRKQNRQESLYMLTENRYGKQPVQQFGSNSNFIKTTGDKNAISQPFIRYPNLSIQNQNSSNKFNTSDLANRNNSYGNLRNSSSYPEKQNFYFLNKSNEPYVDSIVEMNCHQLQKRKGEIQKIYDELRREEEEIQNAYQQYKKSLSRVQQVSLKKSLSRNLSQGSSPKKRSTSKKQQFESNISAISKKQDMSSNFKQVNLNNSTKNVYINRTNSVSPVQMSNLNDCSDDFQSFEIPDIPQRMSGRQHIFVPFNKLYKSPIMQMRNKNTLILSRQSKLLTQKTSDQKIVDGIKYKFSQNIQTDEQELVRNVLRQNHNIIAIVGAQTTLKKKLHMAFIAHAIDKMVKIINSKQHNCLTLSLSYQEHIDRPDSFPSQVTNKVQINDETSIKLSILSIQKTIEQIYQAIKKPYSTNNDTLGLSKVSVHANNKDKVIKIVRFTRLNLSSGKDLIYACHVLSANQYNIEFLRNLQVKDIVWSINPLIKNYDDVLKTLNEANKYNQAKIQE